MAKKSVKNRKTATKKRSFAPKAKSAGKVSVSKKRASAKKKRVAPKARAARKTSKARTTKKTTVSKKRVAPKARAARKTSKARTTKKTTVSKKRVAPKARAARKTSKAKATKKTTVSKKRASAKKRVAPKARAARKTTKAKATRKTTVSKKRASAKKHVASKAKATRKTSKARATKKTTVSKKRISAKKRVAPKARVAPKTTKTSVQRSKPVKAKSEFDFNAWLLPTLELEQYEPHIEQEAGVKDRSKGSTRYAWIGAGQCGGRLVKSFYDLGYKKVLAVNTTHHDLDLLDLPEDQKFLMDIGEKGAGKEMERGQAAVQQYQQEILHLVRQKFGSQVDHIMVCFGAGGGTGSGSVVGLIEIAKRYARYVGLPNPDKNVGVVMTLPTVGEASSPLVAENAYKVASQLSQMAASGKISPLIIVDNDKINKMYPGMTVRSFWPSINNTVASLFDIFNRLSALSSQYTSFDPVDYHSIMESGGCAIMGLTKVTKFNNKFAISEAVKKNLEKTLLAGGFDLSSAKLAGCIVVGGKKIITNTKGLQDNIDYAFDVLSEITGKATIHRGIYEDGRDCLRVYTIIGGMKTCTRRLEELRSRTMVEVS